MSGIDDNKSRNKCSENAEGSSAAGGSFLGRCYEICIGARLDASWSEWFEGLEMRPCGENWTVLSGALADQAALLGILNKLCRLNLPLVSVNEIKGTKPASDMDQKGGE